MVDRVEEIVERYAGPIYAACPQFPFEIVKDQLREFFQEAFRARIADMTDIAQDVAGGGIIVLEPSEAKPPMIDFEVEYGGEIIGQLSAPCLPTYGTRLRVDGRSYTVEKVVFDFDLKQLDLDGPNIVLDAPFKRILLAVS